MIGELLVLSALAFSPSLSDPALSKQCSLEHNREVFSSAYWVEEAGDVVGFELVLDKGEKKGWLFDYQGTPFSQAIPLSGKVDKDSIDLSGWTEETMAEYPSGKKVISHTRARIFGKLGHREIHAQIQIDDGTPKATVLRKVRHIWGCKPKKSL